MDQAKRAPATDPVVRMAPLSDPDRYGTAAMDAAAVCVDLSNPVRGWGGAVLSAYENGLPCITHSRNSAAQILFGTTEWMTDDLRPEYVRSLLEHYDAGRVRAELTAAMPFFSRCYGAFFWRNFFLRYVRKISEAT